MRFADSPRSKLTTKTSNEILPPLRILKSRKMHAFLHELEQAHSLLQSDQIEIAAKAFAQAMKDLDSTSLTTKEPLAVDFSALEALFKVDQALRRIDRKNFWKQVKDAPNFPSSSLLPDIRLFIEQCMSIYPAANDLYRTSQLNHLSQQHGNLPGLQYLLALALINEGAAKGNKSSIEKSLEIFTQLAPLGKGGVALDGLGSQSAVFSQTRINALLQYLRFLQPKQALDILDNELNAGWTREASLLHDHLITRHESLADAVNLTEKMEKSFEASGQAHQIKHIEILAIFFGLIALVVATLQVVPAQPSLSQALALLLGLSLALIGALGIALGLLASTKVHRWCRFTAGTVALVMLGIWIRAISNEKDITSSSQTQSMSKGQYSSEPSTPLKTAAAPALEHSQINSSEQTNK